MNKKQVKKRLDEIMDITNGGANMTEELEKEFEELLKQINKIDKEFEELMKQINYEY